ncbi:MAG: hypothetical protein BHV75_16655 [Bacteroides oleiciplenus]|uniref:Uncharacterized protein n=2 Tax=Bacteroides TaxID=816 RepID=A0A413H4U2_9BACE|nr:MAG: hypothetical protein BHV75_16655 [Bacteroides oleiciplenus]RGN35969.1 hypothetical protein DXB65_10745 [Bacteroides oleiciplenus]RGX78589.1 hypothetical protein DXA68_11250 [Bacteroides stercorirosoris]
MEKKNNIYIWDTSETYRKCIYLVCSPDREFSGRKLQGMCEINRSQTHFRQKKQGVDPDEMKFNNLVV